MSEVWGVQDMSQLDTLKMIRNDCEDDTEQLEGKPLTGPLIAEEFGLVRAMIFALASILIEQMGEEA